MNPINPQNMHPAAGGVVPHTRKMNAVKHGLRSATVLLPGDDIADFLHRRRELFEEHNPCTRSEADCVEEIVACKWRIQHCQRVEAQFEGALHQVAGVYPETGHICEPDPHRWQHRSLDCSVRERRLNKLLKEQLETLFLLQKMRRNRLIDGVLHTSKTYRDFLGDERALEATPAPTEAVPQPQTEPPVTHSSDKPNGFRYKRDPAPWPPLHEGLGSDWATLPGTAPVMTDCSNGMGPSTWVGSG
jgi:hypothetical protein